MRFWRFVLKKFDCNCVSTRSFANAACGEGGKKKGLVLGTMEGCKVGEIKFTSAAAKFNEETGNKLLELLQGQELSLGKVKVIHNLNPDYYAVAVACAGPEGVGYNENEILDECRENIRIASGAGAKALNEIGIGVILVDAFSNAAAAAEGSTLAIWRYQDLKKQENRCTESTVDLYEDPDTEGWTRGRVRAESQNVARKLEETPANHMTPMKFAQAAIDILCPCGVQVDIRDKEWMVDKSLTAFLAMARGSCDPPLFLELSYCGGQEEDKPVLLVGKGVTFDSAGICLKVCKGMDEWKADMAGAAVIVGAMRAIAILGLPINVNALIPLMENMPGGMALKPGDVIVSLNGKTIKVENPDNEGRVILADALAYGHKLKPCLTINLATLTVGIRSALGSSATGAFSTSEVVWEELKKAGANTGDRVWRMPAWKMFSDRVTNFLCCDVDNVGSGRGGTPCLGNAFLLEFAPPVDFLHMDMTGTGMRSGGNPLYLRKGLMTGRPTRTLIQFLAQMACPLDKPSEC
uniref:Cytosol aminopeptidase n=2 Tax=Triatoma infestans TaxID=30076 RepID=A0A023F9A5_TRIIF